MTATGLSDDQVNYFPHLSGLILHAAHEIPSPHHSPHLTQQQQLLHVGCCV